MGEVQEAIAAGKCQAYEFRATKDLSRRTENNRGGGKSKVGASQSAASEESCIELAKTSNKEARHSGSLDFRAVLASGKIKGS